MFVQKLMHTVLFQSFFFFALWKVLNIKMNSHRVFDHYALTAIQTQTLQPLSGRENIRAFYSIQVFLGSSANVKSLSP